MKRALRTALALATLLLAVLLLAACGDAAPEEKPEPRRMSNPPLRKLRTAFPEEMARYDELRQEDPAAAAKLLRELADKLKEQSDGSQRK